MRDRIGRGGIIIQEKGMEEEFMELKSLGIDPRKTNELNDKKELAVLADIIKQSMYYDYKIAYSTEGEMYEEEARSTLGRFR